MTPGRALTGWAVAMLLCVASAANAADESSGVPLPKIAQGQGESCVEDTDFMRRNHMDLLKHQRDETTLRGIRGKQHSLKDCIECHAVNGPDSIPVTISDAKHFCRSCHDYAAVSVDCFQCHASRPDISSRSQGDAISGFANR